MQTSENDDLDVIENYKSASFSTRDENHPDHIIIQLLLAEGADPNMVQIPQFVFSFTKESDARKIAAILVEKGFSSTVYAAEGNFATYDVTSTKPMILDFGIIADQTDYLRQIASENNGIMEGWWLSAED